VPFWKQKNADTPHWRAPSFFTRCISALPEFNQSLLYFFNLFDSRLVLKLLYESINLVINVLSLGLLGAWFRRKEVESAAVGLRCGVEQSAPPIFGRAAITLGIGPYSSYGRPA